MSENTCKDHARRMSEIETIQHKLDIQMTKIGGDVTHIKGRLDNGMSSTMTKIYDKLMELAPIVNDNQDIVGRVKAFTFWIVTIGIGGGLVSFAFHLLRNVGE